jgi:uncharacterized membrane protein YbhN (UPF0104 family)
MEAQRGAANHEVVSSVEHDTRRLRSGIVWTLALALLLIGIGLAIPDLRGVLERSVDAAKGWLAVGIALELASCLGYVATVRLVLNRGPAREVRRLAWAEMAFGAVVQIGGAGGLAVGAWAMRAWGISWSRIANRSAVIFLLTSAINCAVLGIAGVGVWLGLGSAKSGALYGLLPAVAGFGALALFWGLARVPSSRLPGRPGGRVHSALEAAASWVRATEEVILQPHWRLLGAVGYLLFDIAVLWACLRSVGAHPPVLALVAGYQIGYLANIAPIPGGLGVLDGGLLGALVLYGISPVRAAAAVVLYHAIALWLPTIGGTIGFARLRGIVVARRREGGGPDARAGADAGAGAEAGAGTHAGGRRRGLAELDPQLPAAAHATAD